MDFDQIKLNDSLLQSENLRVSLKEAHDAYKMIGEPIYTNYLKRYEDGYAEFDHCMAIVLDVVYMTGMTIPIERNENNVATRHLHCNGDQFYDVERHDGAKKERLTSVDQFIIMEDIIDKRLKYGKLLKNVDGIDLLESVSETKKYFINKLQNMKIYKKTEYTNPPQTLNNMLVKEKVFNTWINDIENM